MNRNIVCLPVIAALLLHVGCGDAAMHGSSYVLVDEATRKAEALWVNQMPVTSGLLVEFDPIEDTVETRINGKRERLWGQGGVVWKASWHAPSSSAEEAALSLQRFVIDQDVRSDAILVDAQPAVLTELAKALSASHVMPLGFGNAVQLEGPQMLMRSAWAALPENADVAFALVELSKAEPALPVSSEVQPVQEPSSERARQLTAWVGLHMQGNNIVRLDASGNVEVIDQAGCVVQTGSAESLVFTADNNVLFAGRPLAPFNVRLEPEGHQ
ncbi:MAG: hypothetical protein SF187_07375 [Deltaproteobacteria bacterium]|nr:hypothetical protein [Deltaproteobacteria bacterium]